VLLFLLTNYFFLGLALPYVKQPASDPVFETFFTKHWVDNYTTSLHNFLATIFHNMRKSHYTTRIISPLTCPFFSCTALPSLLAFNVDRTQRKTQQAEIENLKSTLDNMKAMMEARENEVAKLKVEVREGYENEHSSYHLLDCY
jgi:hypothetical protein